MVNIQNTTDALRKALASHERYQSRIGNPTLAEDLALAVEAITRLEARLAAAEADTKRGRERRRALNQYEAGDFLTADEYFRGLRQRINDRFPEDAARADAPTPEGTDA